MNARPAVTVADFDNRDRVPRAGQPETPTLRKTMSEAISDQACSILSRASATICEEIDKAQKELDELRTIETKKMIEAEEAVRSAMHVCGEVGNATARIREQIAEFRASSAKRV